MAYTAQDIYKRASAILFEEAGEDKDFQTHAPELISLLLGEALSAENSIRAAYGDQELVKAPPVRSLEQEIPYSDEILAVAIPLGLASLFFQDEGDDYKAQDYRGRFLDALASASDGCPQEIEDVYGY